MIRKKIQKYKFNMIIFHYDMVSYLIIRTSCKASCVIFPANKVFSIIFNCSIKLAQEITSNLIKINSASYLMSINNFKGKMQCKHIELIKSLLAS